VTVDTDERWEGADEIRSAVASHPTARTLYALDGKGSYLQPRVIRLPCPARWTGRTHESLPLDGPRLARARFVERQKTPEQLRQKAARDIVTLRSLIATAPTEARWRYYLGDAFSALGEWGDALEAFQGCADLHGWHEEGALACFRAGDILSSELGQHQAAIDVLSAGMARHAGMAELPWMAALACARMGRLGQAVYWARLAQVHGEDGADDGVAVAHRVLLRIPKALREGPDELLFYLFRELGDHTRAAEMAAAIERRWGHPPSASAAA
jgi:tetratricopeptide (TPR) repeat protein